MEKTRSLVHALGFQVQRWTLDRSEHTDFDAVRQAAVFLPDDLATRGRMLKALRQLDAAVSLANAGVDYADERYDRATIASVIEAVRALPRVDWREVGRAFVSRFPWAFTHPVAFVVNAWCLFRGGTIDIEVDVLHEEMPMLDPPANPSVWGGGSF